MVEPAESFRRRGGSAFAVFLLGSVVVHAAVFVFFPGTAQEFSPPIASTLEVVVLQPAALPAEVSAVPLRPRREQAAPRRPQAPATMQPRAEPATPEPATMPATEPLQSSVSMDYGEPAPAVPERQLPVVAAAAPPAYQAAYLNAPAPRYPEAARQSGEQGTVVLRVRVGRDGAASRVVVEKSSGSRHLDAAALQAVRAWRFTPARRGADAVESWMLVPIVFRLEGAS